MKFLCNKWSGCYNLLIQRAREREKPQGYCELHHVFPRCLGGLDEPENLVYLTAREHLLAHKLLVKMTEGAVRKKMLAGLWAMAALRKSKSGRVILTSRQFERLREEYFSSRRGLKTPEEVKCKISNSLKGRQIPKNVIIKRTSTLRQNIETGKTVIKKYKLSDEQKAERNKKFQLSMTPEKKRKAAVKALETKMRWTEEQRAKYAAKLSAANTGKKRTPEQKAKMSDAQKGRSVSQKTRAKISMAQTGKTKKARVVFELKNPRGEIIKVIGKAHEVAESIGAGVKYLYLSLRENRPITKGNAAGWQLISKRQNRS